MKTEKHCIICSIVLLHQRRRDVAKWYIGWIAGHAKKKMEEPWSTHSTNQGCGSESKFQALALLRHFKFFLAQLHQSFGSGSNHPNCLAPAPQPCPSLITLGARLAHHTTDNGIRRRWRDHYSQLNTNSGDVVQIQHVTARVLPGLDLRVLNVFETLVECLFSGVLELG